MVNDFISCMEKKKKQSKETRQFLKQKNKSRIWLHFFLPCAVGVDSFWETFKRPVSNSPAFCKYVGRIMMLSF